MAEEDKQRNVTDPTQNIMNDSFFDSLSEIDDGLGKADFSKLGEDDATAFDDIFKSSDAKVSPKPEEKDLKKTKGSFTPLPTSPINKAEKKESSMTKKQLESMGVGDEDTDPAANQFREIWETMNTPDVSEYKLMVFRLEPQMLKGTKISGYLEAFHLPTTIPIIIEKIGQTHGGGKYQIRIVDGTGKYVRSKTFEIAGLPKLPMPEDAKDDDSKKPEPQPAPEINSLEDDDEDEDWDADFDPSPRRRLRPIGSRHSLRGSYDDFRPIYSDHIGEMPSRGLRRDIKNDFDAKELEEKILTKVESKFDKIADLVKEVTTKKPDTFLTPDVIKAFAPVVVSWLDSKNSKENVSANQFSDMNKQMVGLIQGMQDLVRVTDKAKEDFAEKERREREQNRREMLDHQRSLEDRFLEQQRNAEERHQKMLMEMKNTLESKHTAAMTGEANLRLEYEKMREEFRLREEKLRDEARQREEKVREEQRLRDEEIKRREEERREQQRRDEEKWREELRRRDEDVRRKEIEALTEAKNREIEIMDRFRSIEAQKTEMQQKLLEQVYSNNVNNRESQLHMELAIAKLNSETEAKMLQTKAQMELEKIKHQTQMQITKMKHDLDAFETRKDADPLDSAMQDYLKRRLQIDMIKELNMDVDDDELPNNSAANMAKTVLSQGVGNLLQKLLETFMGGGVAPVTKGQIPGKVVNPSPTPPKPATQSPGSEDVVEDDIADDEEDETEEFTEEDLQNFNPMEEIPRVAQFFEYLKAAIQSGEVTPTQAAEETKLRLSPPVVEYLTQVEDSSIVIAQLHPLLSSVCGEELTAFFFEETTILWMNRMLLVLKGGQDSQETTTVVQQAEASSVKDVDTSIEDKVVAQETTVASTEKPKKKRTKKADSTSNV